MPNKSSQISSSSGMVDISQKAVTKRVAQASAQILFDKKAFQIFLSQGSPKGNVFETAKIAGICAAKATSSIIPLCHPLALSKVNLSFEINRKKCSVTVFSEVLCLGQTGVEMEALSSVTVACLTIYDMMKWADKTMVISDVKLIRKSGGKSGDFILRGQRK